jgi:hypothetical protein
MSYLHIVDNKYISRWTVIVFGYFASQSITEESQGELLKAMRGRKRFIAGGGSGTRIHTELGSSGF